MALGPLGQIHISVTHLERSVEFYRDTLGVPVLDEPQVVHRDDATELWMARVADPDGHHIMLMQERAAGQPPSTPS